MEVIKLLQSKNRCLQRMLDLCCEFLSGNDLTSLDDFIRERDAIIKALDLYDGKITETISLLPSSSKTSALASAVDLALATKDHLVQEIIAKDNEVMSRIEREKTRIQEEITSSRKNRDLVGKFKSTWVNESGEEFDQKL